MPVTPTRAGMTGTNSDRHTYTTQLVFLPTALQSFKFFLQRLLSFR